MDELNSEYSKLMEIIYTYSSLNENFYDILTGKMDDGNALIILESVNKCMKMKIDNYAYKKVAGRLIEEMKIKIKELSEQESGPDEIKPN